MPVNYTGNLYGSAIVYPSATANIDRRAAEGARQIAAEMEKALYGKEVKMEIKVEKKWVVHCKKDKYDVYIGRPSKWGNPFVIGRDGTREQVIQKYEHWLVNTPAGARVFRSLGELEGKVLGCHCAPNACHGDILRKYLPLRPPVFP